MNVAIVHFDNSPVMAEVQVYFDKCNRSYFSGDLKKSQSWENCISLKKIMFKI